MTSQAINRTLNLASAFCLAFIGWRFGAAYMAKDGAMAGFSGLDGTRIRVEGVAWRGAQKNIVLVASTNCHFCKESAPFYTLLSGSAAANGYRFVLLLREPIEDSKPFVRELGLGSSVEFRRTDPVSIGVRMTPTLLVLSSNGVVERSWVGKLTPKQEVEVYSALKLANPNPRPSDSNTTTVVPVAAAELAGALRRGAVVVDIQERSRFDEAHIEGALNIPIDELIPRAPHELPSDAPIYLYCVEYRNRICTPLAQSLSKHGCDAASRVLEYAGFTNSKVIGDDLAALGAAGVPIFGSPCRPQATQ
jgi:hypothetical protein